ncbi:MAG: carboxypeptidase regulatory-like domain-containing protein, partial [Gemmatimonadaceae bacterium]
VQLDGTTRVAATRAGGDFVLDSLPAGTQTVTVRSLGYAPMEQAVDLSSSQPQTITLRLADFVPVLEEVRVTAAKERALDNIGFSRRKRSGMGHFMEGNAINTNALNFSDVMRVAPGIRIVPVMGRQMITSSRDINGCVAVWIDGTQWQQMEPGDIDDFVKPHELAAIEIFSPAQTPAEFQSTRTGSCTTVVAWTVRRLNRKR